MGACFLETSLLSSDIILAYSKDIKSTVLTYNMILTLANGVFETSDAINELTVLLQVCL